VNSHTVPRKLLEQFAYDDPITGSRRLWRYEKGKPPYGFAPPKTATRFDRHFFDPRNPGREDLLESRLNREIEQPVNLFIEQAGYRTFVPSQLHILQLTAYIILLWHRSRARKAATRVQVEIVLSSMRSLLANDQQIATLAAKWMLDLIGRGHPQDRPVTTQEVREALLKMIDDHLADDQIQHTYADTIERALSRLDNGMLNGKWELLHTTPAEPFVIGDAPVVTWERTENNFLIYGQGFSRPNVEVLFPVSPIACLHIQPLVRRTRKVHTSSTQEVNMAQAVFATAHCFTSIRGDALNTILQPSFGRAEIGVTAFNVAHRDYSNTMFEILMNEGRWVQPPLRCH
jgi:hypothetical protein